MIKGIKYFQDHKIRYDQKKNAIEEIIRKQKIESGVSDGYLESCGASAFCTLMEGMDYLNVNNYFRFPSGATIQMDDAVMCYLNDPHNNHNFNSGNIMDNRIYENYIKLADKLFSAKALMTEADFDKWAANLLVGNGVQAVLKTPGHFIALIAYDPEEDVIYFHDSWGTRNMGKPELFNSGKNEKLHRGDMANFKNVSIIYLKGSK